MPEEINPSDGGSVTPTPPQPVTGTAPVGVTPTTATLSLEEAMKRIAELEHSHKNAKDAEDRLGKKLTVYEKAEAAREAAKKAEADAQLSEVERIKKIHAETEQQASKYKQELISARVAIAASAKGIIDPELAALAIQSALEYDKDGMPMNVDEALDTLIKNKPYLAPKPADPPATATPTPAQTAQASRFATPALPAMNPGRTQIAQPGSLPFGKPVRLADIRRNK